MSASERFRVSLVGRLAPKRFSPNRRRRKHALFSVWVRKLGRALKPGVLRRDPVYAPYAVASLCWGSVRGLWLGVSNGHSDNTCNRPRRWDRLTPRLALICSYT